MEKTADNKEAEDLAKRLWPWLIDGEPDNLVDVLAQSHR